MRLPTIEGTIRRRILVNYRVDPAVIQRHLPSRFRPKLADEERFPKGSAEFDHALIMRNIAHEWHSASDLYV